MRRVAASASSRIRRDLRLRPLSSRAPVPRDRVCSASLTRASCLNSYPAALLRRHGPREVWFRRRTYRVKPSANVHLSVGFPAEVPCSGRICGFRVPFENSELRIAALNHKPVNRIAGYRSADFTSEFLKGCHKFLIVSESAGQHGKSCSLAIPLEPRLFRLC
jgi:hypothetical protein